MTMDCFGELFGGLEPVTFTLEEAGLYGSGLLWFPPQYLKKVNSSHASGDYDQQYQTVPY